MFGLGTRRSRIAPQVVLSPERADHVGLEYTFAAARGHVMRLVALLLCGVFAFGQSPAPSPESKAQPPASSPNPGRQLGAVDVLSDTQGVDFGPYLRGILKDVRQNWYRLIPQCAETMKGEVAIEFAITTDGKIAKMRLVATSGDSVLDRAAWGSLISSNPFEPLPSEFTGPDLALRLHFSYNPNKTDSDSSSKGCPGDPVMPALAASHAKAKSGIDISITAPVLGDTDVPLGGSKVVAAVVTGTQSKENTVEWSITGFGCSGNSCGEITKGSYHAPAAMPSSPFVTLTAVSSADPSAKASVTLHLVGSNPSQ
jgi:TonB family protein